MPIDYEIEAVTETRGLVRTVCYGALNLAEVKAHFESLLADPALPPVVDVLLDLCAAESLPDRMQVKRAAEMVGRSVEAAGWGRLAVVAESDVSFGVSRMFGTLVDQYFEAGTVVRTRAEAEAWHAEMRAQSDRSRDPSA